MIKTETIEYLKSGIKSSEKMDKDMNEKSYSDVVGVLISGNEAKDIVQAFETLETNDEELKKAYDIAMQEITRLRKIIDGYEKEGEQ